MERVPEITTSEMNLNACSRFSSCRRYGAGRQSPDVPSNKGAWGVSCWDALKLSFGSFVDMKLITEQLIILFCKSQVGKADIDAQYLQGQKLGSSGFMAPSSVYGLT